MKQIRFPWYEPQAKENYINQQIDILVTALLDRGAQFYLYRNLEAMYVDGQVIDLFRKSAVLAYLEQIKLLPEAFASDVVELFRSRINPLYTVIPTRTYGTINGIKESKPSLAPYLGAGEQCWIKELIESGKLSQPQGV